MTQTISSSRQEVINFLAELKNVISHPQFNSEYDLDILLKKRNEADNDPFTTKNTLLTLGFDSNDVIYQLKQLTEKDYVETIIDNIDPNLPLFYNFGQNIQGREVYIKVKIRDKIHRKIFCVSFHFARYPLAGKYPYT